MRHFILAVLVVYSSNSAFAERLIGLTAVNSLVRFDSTSPETILGEATITGLSVGDTLLGMDVRPSDGLLYGVARNGGVGRIYSVDLNSGVALLLATLTAELQGDFFGVDFNPVADRLCVVSDAGQNLRIDVTTGLTQVDGELSYLGSDVNAGTTPAVVASAYTNSVFPAPASTTLYNFDASIGTLVTQLPPNNGTLNTVGVLGAGPTPDSGFDISGISGQAYAVANGLNLLNVNLNSGEVVDLGAVGTIAAIQDIAVAPVPEPAISMIVAFALTAKLIAVRRRKLR